MTTDAGSRKLYTWARLSVFWCDMAVDACGIEVPKRLRSVFDARDILLTECKQIDDIRCELRCLMSTNDTLKQQLSGVLALLDQARKAMHENTPFASCDCHSKSDCDECGNKRWKTLKEQLLRGVL